MVPTRCCMESNPFPFDSETLLSKANGGRTVAIYRTNQIVFSQGEPADAVFYIQQGQVKLTVLSERGKEAVVAIFGTGDDQPSPQRARVLGEVHVTSFGA